MKDSQQKKDATKKKSTKTKSSNTSSKKNKKSESEKNIKAKSKIELYDLETGNADLEKTVKINVVTNDIIQDVKTSSKVKKSSNTYTDKVKNEDDETTMERKNGFNVLEVIVIIIIALCMGGFIGGGLVHYYDKKISDTTSVPKKFDEVVETYDEIISNYYQDVDSSELLDAAIKGMLDHLGDAHSIYIGTEDSEDFNQSLDGELVGIGCEIKRNEDGTMEVNYPFEGGPAYEAGLKTGDVFVKVDSYNISDLTLDEVSNLIKGKSGTEVTVTVNRDGKELNFTMTRRLVQIPSVVSAGFDRNGRSVGYLGINIFARNTYDQFKEKLEHLEKNNIDSLIIDVRGNSGGHLDIVRDIASLFLEKSKIVYKLDTKGIVEDVYSTSKESRDYPIAVLINGRSASASEILAAALMESYNADVIGVNSYGKGTVQTSRRLDSGATIKYTHQKWLTPSGNWIDGVGVTPTLVVEASKEYVQNPSDETDNQLQAAIDLLSKK